MHKKRIIILGGGYAGLAAMRRLARTLDPSRYSILLIDASAHHTIKSRFHELAVYRDRGRLMRYPMEIFTRVAGVEFIKAHVRRILFKKRVVATTEDDHPYDLLLITLGGKTTYLGVKGAREHTVSLLSYEAAEACGRRIEGLGMRQRRGPVRRAVICGAGIEGVEVAAMLRQYAPPKRCAITIVERTDRLMARSQCGDRQRRYLERYFRRHAVDLCLGSTIKQVAPNGVVLEAGQRIEADLVVWCSGVRRADVLGIRRGSPFLVSRYLQSDRYPEVFAVGDFATVEHNGPWTNLLSAQRAIYQGRLAADNMKCLEQGGTLLPEGYRPRGELIGLGDFDGVGMVGGLPVKAKTAALMKKANEAKYLAELFQGLPGYLLKGSIPEVVWGSS